MVIVNIAYRATEVKIIRYTQPNPKTYKPIDLWVPAAEGDRLCPDVRYKDHFGFDRTFPETESPARAGFLYFRNRPEPVILSSKNGDPKAACQIQKLH
jgi:hypothetical protein